MPEYAACTRAFMEAIGIGGCDVVAHSFGGAVTIQLASETPELFHRLILVDAAGIKPRRGPKYYWRVYTYKLGKILAKSPALNRLFRLQERQKKAGSAEYQQLQGDMRVTYVKTVNYDQTSLLSKIPNETLLIWGKKIRLPPCGWEENGAGNAERRPCHYSWRRTFLLCGGLSSFLFHPADPVSK